MQISETSKKRSLSRQMLPISFDLAQFSLFCTFVNKKSKPKSVFFTKLNKFPKVSCIFLKICYNAGKSSFSVLTKQNFICRR